MPEPFRYRAPADDGERDLTAIAAIFAPHARTDGARGSLYGADPLIVPLLEGTCGFEVRTSLPLSRGRPLLEVGNQVITNRTDRAVSLENLVVSGVTELVPLEDTIMTIFIWHRPLRHEEVEQYLALNTMHPLPTHPRLEVPSGLSSSGLVAKERPLFIPLGPPPPIPAVVAGELKPLPVDVPAFERHLKHLAPEITDEDQVMSVLYAYEELTDALPLVDEATATAVGDKSNKFMEVWRAPHLDDDELVFFAASRACGLHEVRIHTAHHFVEVTNVDQYDPPMPSNLGRALDGSTEQNRATQEAMAVVAFERARCELEGARRTVRPS